MFGLFSFSWFCMVYVRFLVRLSSVSFRFLFGPNSVMLFLRHLVATIPASEQTNCDGGRGDTCVWTVVFEITYFPSYPISGTNLPPSWMDGWMADCCCNSGLLRLQSVLGGQMRAHSLCSHAPLQNGHTWMVIIPFHQGDTKYCPRPPYYCGRKMPAHILSSSSQLSLFRGCHHPPKAKRKPQLLLQNGFETFEASFKCLGNKRCDFYPVPYSPPPTHL